MLQKSNVKLVSLLPLEYRSHDAVAKLMESKVCSLNHLRYWYVLMSLLVMRCLQHLSFLYPLKRIQSDLMLKLKQEPSSAAVYKWIKVWYGVLIGT